MQRKSVVVEMSQVARRAGSAALLPDALSAAGLTPPRAVIFDWHGTLVDTRRAMYNAIDEMLLQFAQLQLIARFVSPHHTRTPDDARLVDYVRTHHRLPSRLRSSGRLSRTDIFEILFGEDEAAKDIAHSAYTHCYRHHCGEVRHLHGDERAALTALRAAGVKLAVASNRDREFLDRELRDLEGGEWLPLFDAVVCGDDIPHRKPAPGIITLAMDSLELRPGPSCWYVGDAATDVSAARQAGVTSVFFNSARWDPQWLARYFPGTREHPHVPDVVVDNCGELLCLIERIGKAVSPRSRSRAHSSKDSGLSG
jgi:phosphoglycolate phosphatase